MRPYTEHRCRYVALQQHILIPVKHMEIPDTTTPIIGRCALCARPYEAGTGHYGKCASCWASFAKEFGL